MSGLDRFFDVYERFMPAWLGDALAAAVVILLAAAIFF